MAHYDRDGIEFAATLRQVLGNPAGEGADAIMEGYTVVHRANGQKPRATAPRPAVQDAAQKAEQQRQLSLVTLHLRAMMSGLGMDPKPTTLVRFVASRGGKVSFDTAYRHLRGDVTNEINVPTRKAYAKAFGYDDVDSIVMPGHLSRWQPPPAVLDEAVENMPAAADVDDVDEAATIKLSESINDLRSVWNTRLGGLAAYAIRRLKRHAALTPGPVAPTPAPSIASE